MEPLNTRRPRTSPAARVHSRSNASWTRRERGDGEWMTTAVWRPSATARRAAWRASCSSESERVNTLAGRSVPGGGSFSARIGTRAHPLCARRAAPSRVKPPTTRTAPAACAVAHDVTSAACSLSIAVAITG